jgi:hypothetical protein
MAFRLRYQFWIDVLPSGVGQMAAGLSPLQGGVGGAGLAQTLAFFNTTGGQIIAGAATSPTTGALASSDVTTLTNNMASDASNQLIAQMTRINNFLAGQG